MPNENGGSSGATCATSGCHTGTANDPNNKGSVAVKLSKRHDIYTRRGADPFSDNHRFD